MHKLTKLKANFGYIGLNSNNNGPLMIFWDKAKQFKPSRGLLFSLIALLVIAVNRFGNLPREFLAGRFRSMQCSEKMSEFGVEQTNNAAWVYMANSDRVLIHTLVSAKSARLHGSTADVIILWFSDTCPQECMLQTAKDIGVQFIKVVPPLTAADMKNEKYSSIITKLEKWWDFLKLEVFNLTQYAKVVFLDG